ncbi:MAG TPA: SIMPL domain-containing protein [Gaiella sp.]|nr:SIMPL domain-containing protein [Gaiella sp.]
MKKIAAAVGLLVLAVAAVAVLQPSGARAVDPPASADTVTVSGDGAVLAVPDRAEISAGVETRARTARAALQANATAMERVLEALRSGGGTDVTTETVSLSTSFDDQGSPNGFVASNIASATVAFDKAGSLIDTAVAAGANTIYGPSPSRSDADALYRRALAKAVNDAAERAAVLAKAAGRELGRVTAISESGAAPVPFAAKAAADASTPVESGPQETTASVSVTYELR